MEAKDLRISNYLQYFGNVVQVEGIVKTANGYNIQLSGGDLTLINSQSLELIPLTQEWLLKFGFFKHEGWFKRGNIVLHPVNNEYYRTGTHYGREMCTVKIEHVNQLQNLYFALTGEELTLKNK